MNVDARFPRSGETRARILAAARRQFASSGYERTTIRSVASEAIIDPSLVMRYFGSKEGLFSAAVVFDLGFPDLREVPPDRLGDALIRHFLKIWEGPEARENLPALLRSATTNEASLKKLKSIFANQVRPALSRVSDPRRKEEIAALVVSQVLGLAYTRYVLRLPPMVKMKPDAIIADVGPVLQRYLEG